jgi:5,10-methylenetetrahydromethanopterin reductase
MSDPVRVHLRVPGTAPMPALMRLIQSIEAAGFDGAGILDSQLLSRDTFVVLGQAATHTSRMALFPAVTNPFTRHASVLASAIQTVEELAPGRVKFVIGTGYTSASTIGRAPGTLAEMRACIQSVRELLAGKAVDFGGQRGRLGYASGRRIPVLMAASGPKAIEVAGEVADGVLLLVGSNGGIVETALGHLERGARRAGRRVEDLEVIWAVRTATMASTEEARRMARPTAVHQVYPDLSHAHDWEAAIKATAFVPDEVVAQLCDAIGLIGTPEDCAARIVELSKLGVRNLYLMPLLTFAPPDAEVSAFRDTVFPRLAAAGLRATR